MAKDIAVATPSIGAEPFPEREDGRAGRWLRRAGTLTRRNPLGFVGLVIIVILAVVALYGPPTTVFGWHVFGPGFAPYGLNEFTAGQPNEGMSLHHWFGTDQIGRDVLSRSIFGAKISLSVAFISVIGGAAIGTVIGIISGYRGGFVDSMI
ncbi:MAG: ABC transporter permease, partial [Dehalococcoidia bacterium]